MASPIRPSDIKDTLPSTDSSACARLKKVIVDFPRRVYDWFSYIYNEDGTFSEAFKNDFCEIQCDDVETGEERPIDVTNPGGNLEAPFVKAGAAMRHNGGIPIVFNKVDGATKYDIYRGTSDSITAATTKRIRKDLRAGLKNMNAPRTMLCERRDGTILYLDVNGGPVYNPTTRQDDKNSNRVDGTTPYYYWVVAKNNNGAKSDFAGPVIGFSRNVTNYSSIGTPKLLFSGQTETPTGMSSKKRMRVVLRGGGGGGGAGGDYALATFNRFHITNISYTSGQPITFTLHQVGGQVHNFDVGDQLILSGQTTAAWNTQVLTVKEILNQSNQFTCEPINGLAAPAASTAIDIPNTSTKTWGVIYALADAQPTRVPGGGGGAGGILQAVFDIEGNGVTGVRVRTFDSANTEVLLSNSSSFGSGYQGDEFTYIRGGVGRQSASADPTAGEPKANDSVAGKAAPYRTQLEVQKGGSWYLIAWVANGEGGGHADADTTQGTSSNGGVGSKQVYWKQSDGTFSASAASDYSLSQYGTKDHSGVAALRTASFGGKGTIFYPGADGVMGVGAITAGTAGSPGVGGHAWDSLEPKAPTIAAANNNSYTRGANAFDFNAPGSGAYGAFGDASEIHGPFANGGHAFGGCAYITYSDATSDYDTA